jgi:hypothetical protein
MVAIMTVDRAVSCCSSQWQSVGPSEAVLLLRMWPCRCMTHACPVLVLS